MVVPTSVTFAACAGVVRASASFLGRGPVGAEIPAGRSTASSPLLCLLPLSLTPRWPVRTVCLATLACSALVRVCARASIKWSRTSSCEVGWLQRLCHTPALQCAARSARRPRNSDQLLPHSHPHEIHAGGRRAGRQSRNVRAVVVSVFFFVVIFTVVGGGVVTCKILQTSGKSESTSAAKAGDESAAGGRSGRRDVGPTEIARTHARRRPASGTRPEPGEAQYRNTSNQREGGNGDQEGIKYISKGSKNHQEASI